MNSTKRQDAARQIILRRANENRLVETLPPFRMKHLQQAVHRVRNLKLVSGKILREAGFNEKKRWNR